MIQLLCDSQRPCWPVGGGPDIATPSSRRRVDGVEVDATIQHERAVKFDFYTVQDVGQRAAAMTSTNSMRRRSLCSNDDGSRQRGPHGIERRV